MIVAARQRPYSVGASTETDRGPESTNRVAPVVRILLNPERALRPERSNSLVALGVLVLLPMFVLGLAVANPDGEVKGSC